MDGCDEWVSVRVGCRSWVNVVQEAGGKAVRTGGAGACNQRWFQLLFLSLANSGT